MEFLVGLFALVVLGGLLILPIIAIVRTARIGELERRIAQLEAAAWRASAASPPPPRAPIESPAPARATEPPAPTPSSPPEPAAPSPPPLTTPEPVAAPAFVSVGAPQSAEHLELVIGRRWIGIVAIALIVVSTAFFLKYAFENRWIGELGRVTLG
ncbi:MAG: hypothetical protein WDO73_05395 [Ignavibacteriota bacterium]